MSTFQARLCDALLHAYGIEGELHRLPGEQDLNFEVRGARDRFVLKVMRRGCDPRFVEMQASAIEQARRAGLGGYLPEVVHTRDGSPHLSVMDNAGEERVTWLATFLPGRLMGEVDVRTPALAASIGRLLGRLDRALETFDHPLLDRELRWDLRRAGWIGEHLGAIHDPARRGRVGRILARFEDELSPRLDALPRCPIHNDANDLNILVGHMDGELRATGMVDFGDMIRTPAACEPAIAMAYAMMGAGDPLERGAALAASYHEARALSGDELALLAPLVTVRLAVSVANAALQRREMPENSYLTISEAPAWRLLDYLERVGEEAFARAIESACSQSGAVPQEVRTRSLRTRRGLVALGNQSLFYDEPLHLVRGRGHFVYDAAGVEYLDVYNNVPHVGHSHPYVVRAVGRQMALLNTNTRYLQDVHVEYAERMLGRLPPHLTRIVFLSSGSEANELALRLARAATGQRDMIVMDHGYHGNTTGAMDISPYKFAHPRSLSPAPGWVHVAPQPDVYRGCHRGEGAADRYLADFRAVVDAVRHSGRGLAGFISECMPSVGGQIVLPPGYLKACYAMVREAGGICIADDVQTGLGRLGRWLWGFQQQECEPDVVVWGKPLGNGFPLAAVAMTEAVADAFARGPEFFATFGGSSAACSAGSAVLDVLEEEGLQARAREIGELLLAGLRELGTRHEIIGDVRGYGLFLGVELVRDRERRTPASVEAARVERLLRERGVLLGREGPDNNVLKIRPPMSFDQAAADRLLTRLEEVLGEVGGVQVGSGP